MMGTQATQAVIGGPVPAAQLFVTLLSLPGSFIIIFYVRLFVSRQLDRAGWGFVIQHRSNIP